MSITNSSFVSVMGLLTFCMLFVGCSDGRPDRVSVSGQVLLDGRPLTRGHIRFIPNGTRPSGGQIDSDGRFTLTCFDGNDGAVPGRHRVEVSSNKQTSPSSPIHWFTPEKYANVATSGLEIDITEPTDSLVIELTSNGSKR